MNRKSNCKQVFIVDDHAILRDGLKQLINMEGDMEVCGEADDEISALQCIEKTQPDIVLLDISLKGSNGLKVMEQIHAQYPSLAVLFLSMHKESLYAERAIRAGARGYIMKHETTTKLVHAIRQVLRKGLYLSQEISDTILMKLALNEKQFQSPVDALSNRELEVFKLVGQGFKPRHISEQMHVSVKTIESYYSRIKDKLNLNSTDELTQYAIQWFQLNE